MTQSALTPSSVCSSGDVGFDCSRSEACPQSSFRIQQRTRGRAASSLLATGMLMLLCEGCILPVPLGAIPAPLKGSGQKVTFHDEDGTRIYKDG